MSLSSIRRPITSCNKPVIKLVASGGCGGSLNGNFYGEGTIIYGSGGFAFQSVTNLKGFVRPLPTEITRQNSSRTCKTQSVQSSVKYEIQGAETFPEWKMREIEGMLQSQTISVDGEDIIYSGGTPFEVLGNSCNNIFRFRIIVEECTKFQIYGCSDVCTGTTETYYMVGPQSNTDDYFGDSGLQIASSYGQLLSYFRAITGVRSVTDIVEPLPLLCTYKHLFKVDADDAALPFFYYDNPQQKNKVFGVELTKDSPQYNELCGNINNVSCAVVILEPATVYELTCGNITIGTPTIYSIGSTCEIMPYPNWEQHTGPTTISGGGNERSISISVFNTDYVYIAPVSDMYETTIALGEECILPVPFPDGSTVTSVNLHGDVLVEGVDYTYDPIEHEITFTPCAVDGDEVKVYYTTGGTNPNFYSEVIAQINGTTCVPKSTIFQTNENNSSIPLGSTISISPDGLVRWSGAPTSADATQSIIEVTNIIYSVIL